MLMSQRSEFADITSVDIGMDWRIFKPELGERAIRIAIGHLALASRSVMADSPDSGWICLKVRPKCEKAVENRLVQADIMAWVPCEKQRELRRHGPVRMSIPEPLLPGYVLVRCWIDRRPLAGLRTVIDVAGFVGGMERPWLINDEKIRKFKDDIESMEALTASRFGAGMTLAEGDRVMITSGPFGGFEVTVLHAGRHRARILFSVFGHENEVSVPLALLKKL